MAHRRYRPGEPSWSSTTITSVSAISAPRARLANLRRNARVEACFLDVLARKAVRIAGTAEIVDVAAASDDIRSRFQEAWAEYLPHMTELVVITIDSADLILSPAYDFGHTEEDLTTAYRSKLANT